MENRTIVKQICDIDKIQDTVMPKLLGPILKKKEEIPAMGIPDYLHYNYAYQCAYDVTTVDQTDVITARKWFKEKKNKQRIAKFRKYIALAEYYRDENGEPIEY